MLNLRQQAKASRAALTEAYLESGGDDFSKLTRVVHKLVGLLEKYEDHKEKFRFSLSDEKLYQLWFVETYLASALNEGTDFVEALSNLSDEL